MPGYASLSGYNRGIYRVCLPGWLIMVVYAGYASLGVYKEVYVLVCLPVCVGGVYARVCLPMCRVVYVPGYASLCVSSESRGA